MSKIRVATAALSGRIYAGYPTKDGTRFREPRHDVTSDAIKAVIDHIGIGNTATINEDGKPAFEITVRLPSSPAEGEALQAGVEAWKRPGGGLNADWVAMVLSEDARIEGGKLANPSYLAVKIADAADMPADVLRLRKALAHIRDHTREATTVTMALGALSPLENQKRGLADVTNNPVPLTLSGSDAEGRDDA